jgi:hypothetical protein
MQDNHSRGRLNPDAAQISRFINLRTSHVGAGLWLCDHRLDAIISGMDSQGFGQVGCETNFRKGPLASQPRPKPMSCAKVCTWTNGCEVSVSSADATQVPGKSEMTNADQVGECALRHDVAVVEVGM